jgi:hypothetical protein
VLFTQDSGTRSGGEPGEWAQWRLEEMAVSLLRCTVLFPVTPSPKGSCFENFFFFLNKQPRFQGVTQPNISGPSRTDTDWDFKASPSPGKKSDSAWCSPQPWCLLFKVTFPTAEATVFPAELTDSSPPALMGHSEGGTASPRSERQHRSQVLADRPVASGSQRFHHL